MTIERYRILSKNTHHLNLKTPPLVLQVQILVVLSDDHEGIALVHANWFEERIKQAMEFAIAKMEE